MQNITLKYPGRAAAGKTSKDCRAAAESPPHRSGSSDWKDEPAAAGRQLQPAAPGSSPVRRATKRLRRSRHRSAAPPLRRGSDSGIGQIRRRRGPAASIPGPPHSGGTRSGRFFRTRSRERSGPAPGRRNRRSGHTSGSSTKYSGKSPAPVRQFPHCASFEHTRKRPAPIRRKPNFRNAFPAATAIWIGSSSTSLLPDITYPPHRIFQLRHPLFRGIFRA